MRNCVMAMSDFDLRFVIKDFKEQGLKKGVAIRKMVQEYDATNVRDVERIHAIVNEVYGE